MNINKFIFNSFPIQSKPENLCFSVTYLTDWFVNEKVKKVKKNKECKNQI